MLWSLLPRFYGSKKENFLQIMPPPNSCPIGRITPKRRKFPIISPLEVPNLSQPISMNNLRTAIQPDPTYIVVSLSLTPKWHFGAVLPWKSKFLSNLRSTALRCISMLPVRLKIGVYLRRHRGKSYQVGLAIALRGLNHLAIKVLCRQFPIHIP
jgi:hypothetical protein